MATGGRALRWYDRRRDRTVCASPTWLTVWRGRKPGVLIAGPVALPKPLPKTRIELVAAYSDWLAAGEPDWISAVGPEWVTA